MYIFGGIGGVRWPGLWAKGREKKIPEHRLGNYASDDSVIKELDYII